MTLGPPHPFRMQWDVHFYRDTSRLQRLAKGANCFERIRDARELAEHYICALHAYFYNSIREIEWYDGVFVLRLRMPRDRSCNIALGGWCQMGVWCAGVGGGGAGVGVGGGGAGAVSGRVLWCGGVCWGLSGRCWAGVGRSGAQPRAHRCGVERSPSTPRRAMLAAAASRLKSASTLARPRTRAWRPPCFRRTRCASLRSTLGRTAR